MFRKNFLELRARVVSLLSHSPLRAGARDYKRRLLAESLEDRRLMTASPLIDNDYRVVGPSPSPAITDKPVAYGTDVFYLDTDIDFGAELRRLNTNTGVVSLVADINPGAADSFAGRDSGLTLVGTKLYFSAVDPDHGLELRWIDVTQANPTVHIIDTIPGSDSGSPGSMGGFYSVGNKLYFMAGADAASQKLYWIDTSADSPTPIAVSFDMGDTKAYFAIDNTLDHNIGFTSIGYRLYFVAPDASSGYELRWIDTAADPSNVHTIDLMTGPAGSWTPENFKGLTAVGTKLIFTVPTDGASTVKILESATPVPTVQTYSGFGNYVTSGNTAYFITLGQNSVLRWMDASQLNPTIHQVNIAGGPELALRFVDLDSGIKFDQIVSPLVMSGTKIYFTALQKIYWLDTSLAAPELDSVSPEILLPQDFPLTVVGDRIYFAVYSPLASPQRWKLQWIDTTDSNPEIHSLDAGGNFVETYPHPDGKSVIVGNRLYFIATQSTDLLVDGFSTSTASSTNLYWVDYTLNQPTINKVPLNATSDQPLGKNLLPTDAVTVGSIMFFTAKDSLNGTLTRWVDTSIPNAPIHTIANVQLPDYGGAPHITSFGVVGTKVYFSGNNSRLSWVDTADPNMTLHVVDASLINAGYYGGFAAAGTKLYFFAMTDNAMKLQWIDTSLSAPVPHAIDVTTEYTTVAPDRTFLKVVGDKLFFSGMSVTGGDPGLKWLDTTATNPVVNTINSKVGLRDAFLIGDGLFLHDDLDDDKLYWINTRRLDPPQLNAVGLTSSGEYFGFKQVGSKVYFDAYDSASNTHALYWIDPATDSGIPHRVAGQYNLSLGALVGSPSDRQFQVVGDLLFFDATDGEVSLTNRSVRWIDTTESDPVVHELTGAPYVAVFGASGSRIYFNASDDLGMELHWVDMNDPQREVHVVDINYSQQPTIPRAFSNGPIVVNDKMYFWAQPTGESYRLIELDVSSGEANNPTTNNPGFSPFHNQSTPTDVLPSANPGMTTSLDVLAIINFLNSQNGKSSLPTENMLMPQSVAYYDVNNDFVVSSLDVLAVINYINSQHHAVFVNSSSIPPIRSVHSTMLVATAIDLSELPNKKKG